MSDDPAAPALARGAFVISLDFELMWGVRDKRSIASYGKNVLGVRQATPRLLDLFQRHGVAATWATVGFLFFESREDLIGSAPSLKPAYLNANLSPYPTLHEIGKTEKEDPYHFGLSLINLIAAAPDQEIATHTFSHYYCLEPGQRDAAFVADLDAAKRAANAIGVDLRSVVFPRNQYSLSHLRACRQAGIRTFRGNEHSPLYRPMPQSELTPFRRVGRLMDAYANLTGHHNHKPAVVEGVVDVPASRFLRPWSRPARLLEPLRLRRILSAMAEAARTRRMYHLWFHPHNFGLNQDENFHVLTCILREYGRLRDAFGWPSLNMRQVGEGFQSGALS